MVWEVGGEGHWSIHVLAWQVVRYLKIEGPAVQPPSQAPVTLAPN